MSTRPSPSLVQHPQSAPEIAGVLDSLLQGATTAPPGTDPLREALVRIAARYGEIVTQCLNAAPDLHLAAFAELLGGQARPAAAARVHVSFRPVAGAARLPEEPARPVAPSRRPVRVPMYTRLAGQAVGSGEPPVFETLADVELVRADAERGLLVDAGHRHVADVHALFSDAGFDRDVLSAFVPVTYALHIGHRAAFGMPGLQKVRVQVDVQDPGLRDPASQLAWVVATPTGDVPLAVERDTTDGLAHSGEVVFAPPSPWPAVPVDGTASLWLTLRLRHQQAASAPAPQWRPPNLARLGVVVVAATGPQAATAACQDGAPLDISKDFFPFGERPRFGAVFQVLCPAFAEPGAQIDMLVRLTNPEGATAAPILPVTSEGGPVVVWEISTASGFQAVAATDGTHSLTQSGSLVFTVPIDVAATQIAGKTGSWLRARLASGHYGTIAATTNAAVPVMRAPSVKSLAVQSTLERGPLPPEHIVAQGALTSVPIDPRLPTPADAFPSPDIDGPALYIGLDALGPPSAFDVLAKGDVISWHARPAPPAPPVVLGDPAQSPTAPRWQMRRAGGWCDTTVQDAAEGLTRSGIVRLTLPEEPADWCGSIWNPAPRKLVWLRVVWPVDQSRAVPRLPIGLAINSVMARHSQILTNEIVGSSSGQRDQAFHALRTPIIDDVQLQVRETDDDWVTWNRVDTLADSQAESREFTLDPSTGELNFGDGRHGRIPPAGANNIRLSRYTTGGGHSGNQPAKAIAQLRSALPAVESAINLEPATGGLDAETAAQVREHASARLRHRDRAICADDFVDLACKASPRVARAFCVAERDLGVVTPAGAIESAAQPGVVSLIVIPDSADPFPQPTIDLLDTVKRFLDVRRSPTGRLVVVGPSYTRITVRLEVTATAGWSPDRVADECQQRVAGFLHPLTGGPDGCGWGLGRQPHRSDIYGLLDTVDGVDFVSGLSLSADAPPNMPIIVAAGTIDVEPASRP